MYRMTSFVAMVGITLYVGTANAALVHQWHLDDNTATDSVGSLDGTPTNTTATTNLVDQVDKAMDFNGSNGVVNFEERLALDNTGTLALLVMVRPDSISSFTTYPFSARTYLDDVGQDDRLYVDFKTVGAANHLRFSFGNGVAFDSFEIGGREGTWLYTGMTWTYDSTWDEYTVTSFCTDASNTVVMNGPTVLGGNQPSDATMRFGTGPSGSGYFDGALDEVSFHDTALTLSELQANYDALNSGGEEPLPGDLNDDGFVGGDDLDIVRSFWGQTVAAGDLLSGDPSEDGFVGGDDLDIVRANWGQGAPPAPSAVPEPASWCLLLAGALGLLWRRKKG